MNRYRCTICNFIYDPKEGDLTADVPPGTPFDDLDESWMCPECGAPVEYFTKL